jgi:hypothetical protein
MPVEYSMESHFVCYVNYIVIVYKIKHLYNKCETPTRWQRNHTLHNSSSPLSSSYLYFFPTRLICPSYSHIPTSLISLSALR